MAALPVLGFGGTKLAGAMEPAEISKHASRRRVRALLLSATTLRGKGSLEHARTDLAALYAGRKRILLINFASLPGDRDAYAARMQRDFAQIGNGFEVNSLHAVSPGEAGAAIRAAEAVFVSGGNTFLLLRELYDRYVVELLRERLLHGLPYAGSSAGSNLAGTVIGTTNDFPLVDIPTRRSLGILPTLFNPHHPHPSEEQAFASRQWKIGQYAEYYPKDCVIGVTNPGMIRIDGETLTLRGEQGLATVQCGERTTQVTGHTEGNISQAIARLQESSHPVAS